jgi:hypothetical protein
MARTSHHHEFLLLLIVAFLYVGLARQMPDPHRYMPHSFLKVDTTRLDQWRSALDDAATDAVRVLNSHRPRDQHLALDQVQTDGVQVGRALAFSGTIELADHHHPPHPSAYTFTQHSDFIHLQPVQPLAPLWALPSPSASLKTEPVDQLPQPDEDPVFPEVELEGPLVLHLDQQLYDPVLRLPHSVEVGAVRVIRVGPGVRLRVGGVSQMKLRSSLDVQRNIKLLALMDENNATTANLHQQGEMDVPELELKLVDQGRAFRMWSSSAERVKAKRRSAHVLELLPTAASPSADVISQVTTTSHGRTDLAPRSDSDASPWVLSQANLLRGVMGAFAQAAEEQPVVLRRVVEAKAEAVSVLVIPMTLREQPHNNHGGETSQWQVVVTRGADGRHTVVSHQQLVQQESHVTVAPWVWANTTTPAVMRTVQLLEKNAHRPAQASS